MDMVLYHGHGDDADVVAELVNLSWLRSYGHAGHGRDHGHCHDSDADDDMVMVMLLVMLLMMMMMVVNFMRGHDAVPVTISCEL